MKILITGSNGQVGTAFINQASKVDYKCIPLNRKLWDMAKSPQNGSEIILEFKPDLVWSKTRNFQNYLAYQKRNFNGVNYSYCFSSDSFIVFFIVRSNLQNRIKLFNRILI